MTPEELPNLVGFGTVFEAYKKVEPVYIISRDGSLMP